MAKKKPDPVDVAVGQKIRARRLLLQMSQEQLGAQLGPPPITFQQIQKYEKGTNRVSASRLSQLAGVLETTPAFFFGANGGGGKASTDEALDLVNDRAALRVLKALQSVQGRRRAALVELVEAVADFDE